MRSCLRGCLERMEIFKNKLIHVRKSAYNGTFGTPKSDASVADIPLSAELAKALRKDLRSKHFRNNLLGVLFANRRLRPFSDNKLREKYLRPLLRSLEMKQVGFHAIRHGVALELMCSRASTRRRTHSLMKSEYSCSRWKICLVINSLRS